MKENRFSISATATKAAVIIPDGVVVKPSKKPFTAIPVNVYHGKLLPWGDMASRVMYSESIKIAFVAVDTLYQRQKVPVLRTLRNDISALSRVNGVDLAMDNLHSVHRAQKRVKHSYKIVKTRKGKSFRKEIRPFYTLKLSRYGLDNFKATDLKLDRIANLDGEDLVQVAALRFSELYKSGLIQRFGDIHTVARFVYRAVNKYIQKQARKQQKEVHEKMQNSPIWQKQSGEDKTVHIDKLENAAIGYDTRERIAALLCENVHHNVDKKQLLRVFRLLCIGYSQAEISHVCGFTSMSVSRAVSTIAKAAAKCSVDIRSILNGDIPAAAPVAVVSFIVPAAVPAAVKSANKADINSYTVPYTFAAAVPAAVPAAAVAPLLDIRDSESKRLAMWLACPTFTHVTIEDMESKRLENWLKNPVYYHVSIENSKAAQNVMKNRRHAEFIAKYGIETFERCRRKYG